MDLLSIINPHDLGGLHAPQASSGYVFERARGLRAAGAV